MPKRKTPSTQELLDRLFVSPAQVQKLLGLSRDTTEVIIKEHLPVVKLGPCSRRIPVGALSAYLDVTAKQE